MSDPEGVATIYCYTLEDAIADGYLMPIFQNRWPELSSGKPIVATTAIYQSLSLAALLEIWNEYVGWRSDIMPDLPQTERQFKTSMNDRKVWVIEDSESFTILYPEDY